MANKSEKKQEEETKPVATPPSTGGAMVVHDYGEDSGRGYEHQSKADSSIPIINLLQALSPIVVAEKAKAGQFYNTVTEQLWDREQGFLFLPATTRHVYAEWVPRNEGGGGGGYRGQHEVDSPIVLEAIKKSVKFGKFKTEEGNNLVETFYVYGVICGDDGRPESMALLPFWSTKIKPYRAWMTRLRGFNGANGGKIPLYANLTRITSFLDHNKENKQFYVTKISSGDPRGLMQSLLAQDDERFQMAKACNMLVDSDQAKVDFSKQNDGGEETGEDAPF